MYKKIIIFICCVSPIIVVYFSGYPVKTFQEAKAGGFVLSKRCFQVGELSQFINCFSSGKTFAREHLTEDLGIKLGSLFPNFQVVFFASLVLLLFLLAAIIFFI